MNRNLAGLRVWQWGIVLGSVCIVWGFTKGKGT